MTPVDTETSRRRTKSGHWLLIGMAVLLVALGGFIVVRRDRHSVPRAQPMPPSDSPPSSTPACLPSVIETGYTRSGGKIDFGMIAENTCAKVAANNWIEAMAVDGDGKRVDEDPALQPMIPVLFPGQRLGAGGTLLVDGSAKVSGIRIRFTRSTAFDSSRFATWPKSVTVTDLKHTGPDSRGLSTVTGTIQADPPTARLCNPDFNLILRNKSGQIVFGQNSTSVDGGPTFEDRFPTDVDFGRTEVYVVQGGQSLSPMTNAEVSCTR
jgi:hypothetical protein